MHVHRLAAGNQPQKSCGVFELFKAPLCRSHCINKSSKRMRADDLDYPYCSFM